MCRWSWWLIGSTTYSLEATQDCLCNKMDVDSFSLHWTAQVRISPKLSKQLTRKLRMALLVEAMQNPKKFATKKNVAICMCLAVVVLTLIIAVSVAVPKAHKKKQVVGFHKDFSITWAENHTRLLDDGQRLELLLDPESGKLQFRRALSAISSQLLLVFCSYSKMIRCECFVSSSALTFVSSSPLWFPSSLSSWIRIYATPVCVEVMLTMTNLEIFEIQCCACTPRPFYK